LATSHDCPMIIRHKMILSLAAASHSSKPSEKSFKVPLLPKTLSIYYNNFPLLNTSNQNRNSSNSYHSHNQTFNIPLHNRFSSLNTFNSFEDTFRSSPVYSPPFNGFYINNKPLFSQMTSRPREKISIRSKNLHKGVITILTLTINYFTHLTVNFPALLIMELIIVIILLMIHAKKTLIFSLQTSRISK